MKHIFGLLFLLTGTVYAYTQTITLDDIWKNYTYYAKGFPGFQAAADGIHYYREEDGTLKKIRFKDGKTAGTIDLRGNAMDQFQVSNDEKYILYPTNVEHIYRYSFSANYKLFDVAAGTAISISPAGRQKYGTLSPDGKSVGYVSGNNLFFYDIASRKNTAVTNDGKENAIINGGSDWVYEEEFTLVRAFEWNSDGSKIAYYRFDESEVPTFEMAMFGGQLYPRDYVFKYPKVGEANSKISLFIYDLDSAATREVKIPSSYEYVPRIKWTNSPGWLCVTLMNRLQNELVLMLVNAYTGETRELLKEKADSYIEINDYLTFLPDNRGFIWVSERDGYNHIYHYGMDGNLVRQVTSGKWDMTKFYGYDAKKGLLFFQSAEVSPMERHLYSIRLDGTDKKQLTSGAGVHDPEFSEGLQYYVNTFSAAGTPYYITLHDQTGKQLQVLEDNKALKDKLSRLNVSAPEFIQVPLEGSNDVLNGWMIKPPGFSESKKYPVLMYVYGGPGSQTAENNWGGQNYMWFMMLAQKGYIVVSVDNRGTGARGRDFRTITYGRLGKVEADDQIEAAKYLGKQPYVDASRIGIFGWSYGGYMSSLCITRGADVFKTAIAVAPVTNWKFYDNIYTERYMGTMQTNPTGFDANAPIAFAPMLKGNYLLIHGTADDNVHWQNTAEMISALVKANRQFDQFIYPDKNHGIYGGNTRLHLFTMMTDYLLEKL